jgi:hypothetical protein
MAYQYGLSMEKHWHDLLVKAAEFLSLALETCKLPPSPHFIMPIEQLQTMHYYSERINFHLIYTQLPT